MRPKIGSRIEIAPRYDWWLRGARYGTVVRYEGDRALVHLDKVRRPVWVYASDLTERGMRALLIDPVAKTVSEIDVENDWQAIAKAIGCSYIEAVPIGAGHVMYVDEEGLLQNPRQPFFETTLFPQPLCGKAIILGVKRNGDETDATVSVGKIMECVRWPQ